MNILPKFKIGDCCCGCRGKGVAGRKVGKLFYCLDSYTRGKQKQQIAKANERNAVRGLPHISASEKDLIVGRNQLIEDIDYCVSRIVRLRAADDKLNLKCYTCGDEIHWSKAHNSHFISRRHLGLRFDLNYNCRPACFDCNVTLHGNLGRFADELEKEKKGIVEELQEQSRQVEKPTNEELKQLLSDMRTKLRILEQCKGIRK